MKVRSYDGQLDSVYFPFWSPLSKLPLSPTLILDFTQTLFLDFVSMFISYTNFFLCIYNLRLNNYFAGLIYSYYLRMVIILRLVSIFLNLND